MLAVYVFIFAGILATACFVLLSLVAWTMAHIGFNVAWLHTFKVYASAFTFVLGFLLACIAIGSAVKTLESLDEI